MFSMIQAFWQDEDGAAAIEYALIAALIALGITVGAQALGGGISQAFTDMATALGAAMP